MSHTDLIHLLRDINEIPRGLFGTITLGHDLVERIEYALLEEEDLDRETFLASSKGDRQ